jgi:hypothetical protein
MMMPERNQRLDERNEQLATEDEYQRPEQTTAAGQQRGTDEIRSDEMRPDEMRSGEMRSGEMPAEEMRSGEMPAEETTHPEQTASGPTRSGDQVSGERIAGEQVPGQQFSGQADVPAADGQRERERIVPEERAASYASRWDAIKGAFVDEPRQAVAQADALVGELLDELETLFREQRRDIEHGLDADETSTEDLRMALRRYRSFFDRLLAV